MVSLAGSENVETMEMHLQHAQNTMEFAKFLRHPKCRVVFPQVFQICWMRYLKLYEHYELVTWIYL